MNETKELKNIEEYNDLLSKNTNIIIKFYTTWCGPCKLLAPQFESAKKHFDNIVFATVNAETASDISSLFNISSVPVVILIKNKNAIARFEGFRSEDAIVKFIQDNI